MPKRILLADDSVTIRKVVELTFNDTDIRVESVGTGREALERIAAIEPDLVLADVIMPEPTGYDICRTVKASARPVPVILLAGTFEPFDSERARAAGADGHLIKPFETRVLLERVVDLLSRPSPPEAEAGERPREPGVAIEAVLEELLSSPSVPHARASAPAFGPGDEELDWLLGREAPPPARTPAEVASREVVPEPSRATELPLSAHAAKLTAEEIDALARAVVEKLSDRVLREIAWEVVPDLAEAIIKERIRELERQDRDGA